LLRFDQVLEKQQSASSRRRRSQAAVLVPEPDDGNVAPGGQLQAADPYDEDEDQSDFEL
jgi:hypothetical protein